MPLDAALATTGPTRGRRLSNYCHTWPNVCIRATATWPGTTTLGAQLPFGRPIGNGHDTRSGRTATARRPCCCWQRSLTPIALAQTTDMHSRRSRAAANARRQRGLAPYAFGGVYPVLVWLACFIAASAS
jgi:hypothetical protein